MKGFNIDDHIVEDGGKVIELDNTKEKIKAYKEANRLIYVGGRFCEYTDGYYKEIDKPKFKRKILESEQSKKYNRNKLDNLMDGLKTYSEINIKEINPSKYINLQNGLFNTETYELENHWKDIYSTIRIPVKYDPDVKIDKFQKFLDSSIPNKTNQAIIQEFLGYSLSTDTKHEKALFLIGEGGNGKGVLMKLLTILIGKENISYLDISDLGKDTNRVQLFGKLLNISTEMNNKITTQAFKIFKQVTSFESITGKILYTDIFSFKPKAKFVFSVNNKPVFPENNEATFRRLLLIDFPNSFGEKEEGAKYQKNPNLIKELKEEIGAIFNWCIEGLKRLRKNDKFTQDETTLLIKERFRIYNDSIGEFFNRKCNFEPDKEIAKAVLYEAYKQFCFDNDVEVQSDKSFGKMLLQKPNVSSKRFTENSQKITRYFGVNLNGN